MVTKVPASELLIELPETVDLLKLAASLEVKGASRKLTGALRTAWRTQSCLADLRQAAATCQAIEQRSASSALDP